MTAPPTPPDLLLEVDLASFLVALETRIQAALPPGMGVVRCRVAQERLLVVLTTGIAPPTPEPSPVFAALAQGIQTALLETELPEVFTLDAGELSVRLYLQHEGHPQPYAARNWHWRPGDAIADLFDRPLTLVPPNAGHGPTSETSIPPAPEESSSSVIPEGATQGSRDRPPLGTIHLLPDPVTAPGDSIPLGSPPPSLDPTATSPHHSARRHYRVPWTALILGGLILGGIGQAVARPCVIGGCPRRETANDLSSGAMAQLSQHPTGAEVVTAHDQLREAVGLLAAVPSWSPHYQGIQGDLARYRGYLADLEWILAAQTHGLAAATEAQSPPHSVAHWRTVYDQWQQAIVALDRVPADSPLASLAATRRATYEANHQTIGRRIETERGAEVYLNQALQLAQSATQGVETASTLVTWEATQRDWQGAIAALRRIPRGTLAYGDSRSMLQRYQAQLADTRTQVLRERGGDYAYQRAIAAAQAAQAAEGENQWTRAVTQWGRAIEFMEQVPEGTGFAAEAAARLPVYQTAQAQAQGNLRQAIALQSVAAELETLCPGGSDRCTYTTVNRRAQIQLQAPYDRAILQAITPPDGATGPLPPAPTQSQALIEAIMALGNQIQMPLEIQDAEGSFLARYHPDIGGFRRQ